MSKLMWIAGILFIAAGIALGLMVFVSTATVISWGITLEVAAVLLVGGVLSLGLGGVIHALDAAALGRATAVAAPMAEAPAAPIPEFGRRVISDPVPPRSESTPIARTAPVVAAAFDRDEVEVSEPVKETIQALEQARQKIEQAFEPKQEEPAHEAAPEPEAAPQPTREPIVMEETIEVVEAEFEAEPEAAAEPEEEAPAEGQLYVVEERMIRARPARILSDGTVEAETDEGWMRFENLEHLDEYLDAMSPAAQA